MFVILLMRSENKNRNEKKKNHISWTEFCVSSSVSSLLIYTKMKIESIFEKKHHFSRSNIERKKKQESGGNGQKQIWRAWKRWKGFIFNSCILRLKNIARPCAMWMYCELTKHVARSPRSRYERHVSEKMRRKKWSSKRKENFSARTLIQKFGSNGKEIVDNLTNLMLRH